MYKINLVEDELDLANLVVKYLNRMGYDVNHYMTGEDAMKHVEDSVDLWILDIMLTGNVSGYDLIKEIKAIDKSMPVIFTSARNQDIDKILGLELGGDDYLAKPFSLRELLLRIQHLLARAYGNNTEVNSPTIEYDVYTIDPSKRSVKMGDETIALTSKEYDLMYFLIKNRSKAFDREEILKSIWGEEYDGSNRVVDDLMRRLRQKMPKLRVETIYGRGYRLL